MANPLFLRSALAASLLFTVRLFAEPSEVPNHWFVWPMVEPVSGSALDASMLNQAPITPAGRVTTKGGHFVTSNGETIRFFGVNIAGEDAFPTEKEAEQLALRLAKGGVNIARLHHLDNAWGAENGGNIWPRKSAVHLEVEPAQLAKLHALIAALARHGIYTNLNLKVSKTLTAEDGFPASVAAIPSFQKRVDIFDRRMIELQKDYARRLLTTKNPYTGFAPADDPAVAVIEINNENSLLGFFTRDLGRGVEKFPEPFRSELQSLWNAWLARQYAGTPELSAAWAPSASPSQPVSILDTIPVHWIQKLQPGNSAKLTSGETPSAFSVDVEKTTGTDWHVQISTHGFHLEDNVVYTLSFEVRAHAAGPLGVGISNDMFSHPEEEWRSLGLFETVAITKTWQTVRFVFPAHSVGGNPAKIDFNVAAQPNHIEIRNLSLVSGATGGGVRDGQSLENKTIPLPGEPSTRQWADWIQFLADTDRAFAEEMRAYLRNELGVKAPIICSQINFSGLTALDREQSMDFADTHTYWQHPEFIGNGDWDRTNWTIQNSPQVSAFGPRKFGTLGTIAFHRVAGKPYSVSEYDHAAPTEFACEMYPELAVFGARQDWDAVYVFDLGSYGTRNPDGRISSYFDQINHPAKWSLAPLAARLFRLALISPAGAVAELHPGKPVWAESMHFDMLWASLVPNQSFNFLNCRLQVSNQPQEPKSTLSRSGQTTLEPSRLVSAPQGTVLVAADEKVALATGFLGGATIDAGPMRITCPHFGRDFGTVSAVSLDQQPLGRSGRILVTVVSRAENQGMIWNTSRTSVNNHWGHGPTIAERVPATVSLTGNTLRKVYALAPDGTRSHEMKTLTTDSTLSFTISATENTLQYEIVDN